MKARSLLPFGAAFAALCLLTIPGCLFASREETKYRGQFVPDAAFSRVQPGATDDEVRALFGEPTTKSVKDDKTTWRYHYTKATTTSGAIFLLLSTTTQTEYEGMVMVAFVDDIVTKVTRQ